MLLPLLAIRLKYLKKVRFSTTVCLPLLREMMQGIQTQFSALQFNDMDCNLAADFHLRYKLV